MKLTKRDMFLLEQIQSYGFLTTKQIMENVLCTSSNRTTILCRLRDLESNRYLQRLDGLRDYAIGWALTRKSAKMFAEKPSRVHFPRHLRDHELLLTRVRFHVERNYSVKAWIPEHEIRSDMAKRHGIKGIRERVVPDGIASIERRGINESVAIELELCSKNSKRYRQSHSSYCDKKSLFGVWYIVGNPAIGKKLLKVWKTCPDRGPNFFWSNYNDLLHEGLNTMVYGVGWQKPWGEIINPDYKIVDYTYPSITPEGWEPRPFAKTNP